MIDAERWDGWGWEFRCAWPCVYSRTSPRWMFQWTVKRFDMNEASYLSSKWPDTIAYADAGTEAV